MTRYRLASQILAASLGAVIVASIAMSFFYSQAISSIKLTALDQGKEPRDAVVLGMGNENSLPDYRLEIIDRNNKVFDLGTQPNQSALLRLTWKCTETIPRRMAASLRLVEDDLVNSDFIEEIAISGDGFESNNYKYQLNFSRSFYVGILFFLFPTPIGWVVVGLFVILGVALASNICVAS